MKTYHCSSLLITKYQYKQVATGKIVYGASWLLLLTVINTCESQQINVIKPHISSLGTGINMIWYDDDTVQEWFYNNAYYYFFIISYRIQGQLLSIRIKPISSFYKSEPNRTTQVQSIVCTMLTLVTYRFCTQHQSEASKKVPRWFCQNPKRRWIWQFCTNHFIVRVGSNTNQRTSPSLPSSRPKSFKFWYLLWWSGGVGWFLLTNTTKQRFCVPKKERKHATT